MFLGIEIGGTKLQLGLGRGDGTLLALWREAVDTAAGGEGIRRQIIATIPVLLAKVGIGREELRGIGVGFGGPTDDATQSVIKSHHIAGWDGFPLASWLTELVGLPSVICNDADVAGLAEALFGAGRGLSPVFYITVGTGIGGGLIIDGEMYRGQRKGASEIGHLRVGAGGRILERCAAGWGIAESARDCPPHSTILSHAGGDRSKITAYHVGLALREGDTAAVAIMGVAIEALATAISHVITLLCPRRVVIGGGVSLLGEDLFFEPLRTRIAGRPIAAFDGLTDIVPAALGEEVVVHGALALARRKLGE